MALINDKEYYLVCQDNGDTCALLLPEKIAALTIAMEIEQ